MSSSVPFIDPSTGKVDTDQVLAEAVPLAKLIALFAALAAVPLLLVFLMGARSGTGAVFVVLAQFILAIGAGIVLIYVITRAIQLAEE